MFLPKIKTAIRTGNIELPDGSTKAGTFIETFLGKFLFNNNKTTIDENAVEVVNLDLGEITSQLNTESTFKTTLPQPNEKDQKKGSFKRYFIQDKRNKNINEVSKDKFSKFDNDIFTEKIAIDWILTPPAKDVYFNGKKFEGSESKNKNTILIASQKLRGLNDYITDYAEFIESSDIPLDKFKNIESIPTSFNLPSPSSTTFVSKVNREPGVDSVVEIREDLFAQPGQFINADTGAEYIGPYHEHPELGAMVGAKHIQEKHSKLIPIKSIQEQTVTEQDTSGDSTTYSSNTSAGENISVSDSSLSSLQQSDDSSGGTSIGSSGGGGGYGGY